MEKTNCYNCETEITAPVGSVHPICSDCQTSFDEWFTMALEGKA
jgi:hypothetical protein